MLFFKTILRNIKFSLFLMVLACFLFSPKAYAQKMNGDTAVQIKTIALSEITFRYESLLKSLEKIREESQIPTEIIELDSNYSMAINTIDSLLMLVMNDSSRFSLSRLNNLEKEWMGYKDRIHDYQIDVASHSQKLEANLDTLVIKDLIWKGSLISAEKKEAPPEILKRIKSAIDSIEMINMAVSGINNRLIRFQDKLIYAQNKVSDVIDFLKNEKSEFTGQLFVLDSPPFWNWTRDEESHNYWKQFKTNWAVQGRIIDVFLKKYQWVFVFHFLVFMAVLILFRSLRKKYNFSDLPGDDQRLKMAFLTLSRPFFSAFSLALLVSIYFYKEAPEVFFTLLTVLAFMPTIALFPKYVRVKRHLHLYILMFAFIFSEAQELLIFDPLLNRLFQILKALFIAYVLAKAYQNIKNDSIELTNTYWKKLITFLAPLYIGVSIISVFANIIGAYLLSELLVNGVIKSSLLAMIIFVFGVVTSSVLVILLRSKYASSLKVFTTNSLKFESRITGLIFLYMIYLWIESTVREFQLLAPIKDAYTEFIGTFWIVGGVKISVGGLLSFVFILIVTFLVAKVIKEVVNDNVFPTRKATRGLPNAFSMVIRYMVVTLGVYIALSAAGINLSEFGLMAGALGVGLGFGLQNILHNLVSGLIVSFERPIHVGDTVQVDTLHGTVTEIGVRSSKIRTFDGSEVILPNGDLLSKQVINWTLTDQKRRVEIKIRTSYDANPREVIDLLMKEVAKHANVMMDPNPMCLFEGYGDSALNFRVLFWVDYNVGLSTKSAVALGIYDKLKELNIEAPIPQQRISYQDKDNIMGKPL